MRSKGSAPTAAQKRWREAVRAYGSVITGNDAVVHHCVGCTGKHNKVEIGHWFILPLTNEEHLDLHAGETFGYESRKEFEKAEFMSMVYNLITDEADHPPTEVKDAILGYHR